MKKLLFFLMPAVIMCSQTHAQITYHDIVPDSTVDTWNAFSIVPLPASVGSDITIWYHPGEISIQSWNQCEILFNTAGTFPLKLNAGDSIGSSGKYKLGNYDVLSDGTNGLWATNATDKYLGFRIKNGSTWNYGWIKMTVNGAISFTAQEWAFNTSGGKINAGQKTSTGITTANNEHNISIAVQNKTLRFTNLDAGTVYQVSVINTQGQTVQQTSIHANEPVAVNDMASGIYMVQLSVGGFVQGFKVAIP